MPTADPDVLDSPICPACSTAFEAPVLHGGTLTFCPNCCRTLHLTYGIANFATAADVDAMAAGDLNVLRTARNAARRAKGLIK